MTINQQTHEEKKCMQCNNWFSETRKRASLKHHKHTTGWKTGWLCEPCTGYFSPESIRMSRYGTVFKERPMVIQEPDHRIRPEFSLLAVYMEDPEAKRLFGNFKALKTFCAIHGYTAKTIKYAKDDRRNRLGHYGKKDNI